MSISEDNMIRPSYLKDYSGQESAKKSLSLYIKSAKIRNDYLDHIIIYGPSGLGKTTLAKIVASEMNSTLTIVEAPTIKNSSDLINTLSSITEGEILFIDEIHRLSMKIEEILYFAMEDFILKSQEDNETIKLPKFTLIGATTKLGMLSEPLRNRFGINIELHPYDNFEITDILLRSANILNTFIDLASCEEIAKRSRGIPRIANGFLKRARDLAIVNNNNFINTEVVLDTFEMLDIDSRGLTRQDRNFLNTIIKRYDCGPVGLTTLCSAINDDKKTIEEVIEPYLINIGFLEKTPRGRIVTKEAKNYLRK